MKENYVISTYAAGDSATAATVSFAKSSGGSKVYLTTITAGFSGTATKELSVTEVSTKKFSTYVANASTPTINFDPPLELNDSATVSLAASAGASVIPVVSVTYFKR